MVIVDYQKSLKACQDAGRSLIQRVSGRETIRQKLEHLALEQANLHSTIDKLVKTLALNMAYQAELFDLGDPYASFQEPSRSIATESRSAVMPILINTMPKSGSIYLSRMIASSLGIEYSTKSLAYGFFPTYFMLPDALEAFRRGNILRQEHFDASPINLKICALFIDRMVLHTRDPRGALLSWTHHINRLQKQHPNGIESTIHPIPDDFPNWSLSDQVDWHIDRHLVSLVTWLRQWLAVPQAQLPFNILWTTHDDLVNNERALFDRVLGFFEIPMDRVDFKPPEKTMEVHYRSGKTNEWAVVLSAQQKARCADIIGKDLLDHFCWNAE